MFDAEENFWKMNDSVKTIKWADISTILHSFQKENLNDVKNDLEYEIKIAGLKKLLEEDEDIWVLYDVLSEG